MAELEGRSTPGIEFVEGRMRLSGEWTLRRLSPELKWIREQLRTATPGGCDMGQVTRLDNFGAQLLWRAWGGRFPDDAVIPPRCRPCSKGWPRSGWSPRRNPAARAC